MADTCGGCPFHDTRKFDTGLHDVEHLCGIEPGNLVARKRYTVPVACSQKPKEGEDV